MPDNYLLHLHAEGEKCFLLTSPFIEHAPRYTSPVKVAHQPPGEVEKHPKSDILSTVQNHLKWGAYYRLLLLQTWKESRKNVLSTVVAGAAAALGFYLQFRYYVVPFSSNLPKLLTSLEASLIVLFVYFMVYALRSPWILQNELLDKIGDLQSQAETPCLKPEIIRTQINTETISNYVSAEFPEGGYFGIRILVAVRIANQGRVPTTATVIPDLEKEAIDFRGFEVSLIDLDDPLDLHAPIAYAVPRSGSFALVLPGKRESDIAGSVLKVTVKDGIGQTSTADKLL